jgi:hypothetical protein
LTPKSPRISLLEKQNAIFIITHPWPEKGVFLIDIVTERLCHGIIILIVLSISVRSLRKGLSY